MTVEANPTHVGSHLRDVLGDVAHTLTVQTDFADTFFEDVVRREFPGPDSEESE